jgi:RNA polymerase sigma-70 factor (ECF subfamily)
MPPDDHELCARIARDDRGAFQILYLRYADPLYGFAVRRLGSAADAEDLVATVFLEAWRQRSRIICHERSLRPWLFGVASNLVRRQFRTRHRHGRALDTLAQQRDLSAEQDAQHDAAAIKAEADHVLRRCASLPKAQRDVLRLRVWEHLSYEEIALVMGVPVGTVRSRLARARRRLEAVPDPDPAARSARSERTSDALHLAPAASDA